ncbi:MAG: S8 family serine peptidase, partial [Phycisphaerae bacterium]
MSRGVRRSYLAVIVVGVLLLAAVTVQAQWHYYYFKEPQPLMLDVARVAVFEGEGVAAVSVSKTLSKHGFAAADVRASAIPRMSFARTPVTARSDADVQALVKSIADAQDVEFVSPVFLDGRGEPVIITRYLHVGFQEHVKPQEAEAIIGEVKAGVIKERDWSRMKGVYRLECGSRSGFEVLELANRLAQRLEVRFAQPGVIISVRKEDTPNDPGFPNSWGLHNTGQTGGTEDMDMDGPEAWDITEGDPDIIVVVMDDGVQQDHPDINRRAGADFTGSGSGGDPVNVCDNHGTAVAGCASAIINNSLCTTGIAPGARVASAKWAISYVYCQGGPVHGDACETDANCHVCVEGPMAGSECIDDGDCPGGTCNKDGTCTMCGTALNADLNWLVNALNWAQTIGARVTNSSFSTGSPWPTLSAKYESTREAGLTHFAATGNGGGGTISYPASLDCVNAVSALTDDGEKWQWSQYGTGLAFSAPGVNIYTTDRTGSDGYLSGDCGFVGSGTSFASPFAAGVAALVLSLDPSLTPDDVEQVMQETCMDLPIANPNGYDTSYGWGFVNAYQAVLSVIGPVQHCELGELAAFDAASGDHFGNSVSISSGVSVVGARNAGGVGAAYVYRWEDTAWGDGVKLTAFDGAPDDLFGYSVSVSGDVIVIGARADDYSALTDAGSAYVYRWDGDSWDFEQKLTASEAATSDWFGASVAVSGDVIVVGAPYSDAAANNAGAAYIYRWDGGTWGDEVTLTSPGATLFDSFGASVAASGDVVLVGISGDDDEQANAGAAAVYRWNGDSWDSEQKLTALDAGVSDLFGFSVSVSGNYAAIGSPKDDDQGSNSGSAYVFEWNGATWNEQEKFTASYSGPDDDFGASVSIGDDCVVVGAAKDDVLDDDTGSVYVFGRRGSTWSKQTRLTLPDAGADDQFGVSVAVSDNFAVVGALARDPGGHSDAGSAYTYGVAGDCNENTIEDVCDILDGTCPDEDGDWIPDVCCTIGSAPAPETPVTAKNRYISFMPTNPGEITALRVTLTASALFPGDVGMQWWVDPHGPVSEAAASTGPAPAPTFMAAELQSTWNCMDWSTVGLLDVSGCEIVPSATYDVQAID